MNLLRSINIADDRTRDEVIAAYHPTRKTLQVVRAICGLERSAATHVVAPYGAGKSLAALAGITLMAGKTGMAQRLRDRIATLEPTLAAAAFETNGATQVLLLHGACPNLAAALAERAGVEAGPLGKVLSEIQRQARKDGTERIAIVWDEFGQHLETLVREGRPEDLLAVQDLAEWAVRRSRPRVTLTTLMHQGVNHYTRRVSDTAQSAWKKIEGRFETLSLIDDGVDALEMLAEALDGRRPAPDAAAVARARAAGFFADVPDDERLGEILARTAPLTPATLQILPRLAAQVAQSERTMFRFISDVTATAEPGVPVGVDALYDFFAPAMRSDTGPGGTHRRFVEAETALSRAETDLERRIIKIATLLQLGRSSERLKLPRARLVYAASEGSDQPAERIEAGIEVLVARKVLLHRRRLDDVSVWHGADIDLAQMVAEEAARLAMDSDPIALLEQLFPPDAYIAPPYNHARGIIRFARARFVRAADLTSAQGLEALRAAADAEDALVALVIDATADRSDVREIAQALPQHLVVALPRRSAEVASIVADLMGLDALLDRRDVLETDPLIERELRELKAEAEAALRQTLERLMNPDRGDVVWVSGPTVYNFPEGGTAGEILSRIFEARFPHTPLIANEQVVRRKVSPVTRSARKRCMLAILERSGIRSLGYDGATSADASLYRTVLERTGLYSCLGGSWRWSAPGELKDSSMQRVWSEIEAFFVHPADQPKSFEDITDRLIAPPIGLREGVLPLLLTAGMIAFGRALALRQIVDGRTRYVDDVQPSIIEKICEGPRRFELEVFSLTEGQLRNLERMIQCLVGDLDPQEPDLLRGLYDALLEWKSGLPPTALHTRGLGESAALLQPLLRKKAFDPADFLFRDFPRALGDHALKASSVEVFSRAVLEIESVSSAFADRAVDVAAAIFNGRLREGERSLLDAAAEWATCVPLDDETVRTLDHEARGVLARARGARNAPRGVRGFVTQLSGILCGEGFESWDDKTMDVFRGRLEEAVIRIEDAVLERADGSDAFEPFLRNRLATIFDVYGAKIGRERLINHLNEIYGETS